MQYKCQYYEQKNLNILGGKKVAIIVQAYK